MSYHSSPVPSRQGSGYDKGYLHHPSVDEHQVGVKDVTVHRNHLGAVSPLDYLNNTELKTLSSNLSKSLNGPKTDSTQLHDRANGHLLGSNKTGYTSSKMKDVRLCSEPPVAAARDKPISPYNKRGVQETGTTNVPGSPGVNKPTYLGSTDKDRYADKGESIYPPSPRFMQASHLPYSFKQASSPVCKDGTFSDPHSQNTLPAAHRSVTFKCQNSEQSRSMQDKLKTSLDAEDDGTATTTSDSYTIDPDELPFDVPHTDVFV